MMEIVRRRFEGHGSVPLWRLNIEGNLENDIIERKVEKLPKYTFRDDGMKVYKIIKKYVENKVKATYEGNNYLHIIIQTHLQWDYSHSNLFGSCLLLFYLVKEENLQRNDL